MPLQTSPGYLLQSVCHAERKAWKFESLSNLSGQLFGEITWQEQALCQCVYGVSLISTGNVLRGLLLCSFRLRDFVFLSRQTELFFSTLFSQCWLYIEMMKPCHYGELQSAVCPVSFWHCRWTSCQDSCAGEECMECVQLIIASGWAVGKAIIKLCKMYQLRSEAAIRILTL